MLKANPRNTVLVEARPTSRETASTISTGRRRAQAGQNTSWPTDRVDRIMTISYGEGRLACPTNADPC